MAQITDDELIEKAKRVVKVHKASKDVIIGGAGCALITNKNNIYVGVNIDACCGIGFCAEHSAIANMVTNKEYKIKRIVAVAGNGKIMPPCGRCRELMYQISDNNLDANIIIEKNRVIKLRDLLPEIWQKKVY